MGPLELGDFIGLDVVLAIMQNLQSGFQSDKYAPCPYISELVSKGCLGRKTKSGFYIYE
jgi:3-hydroxybutyryl-CoA dehydrogenase